MGRPVNPDLIEEGWDVFDDDGELVGTVIEATDSYVLVEQGRFFPDDVYVPLESVASIDAGAVRLAVSGQTARDSGWHAGPPVGAGAFSTEYLAPGIVFGGQVEELGTTEDDLDPDAPTVTESVFQPEEIEYIESQPIGRLATADPDGQPHVVPMAHRYNQILDTIDIGGHEFASSRSYQNVAANGRVAYVIDDIDSQHGPRGIEIRGRGELQPDGGRELGPNFDDEMLRIYPEHIARWGIGSGND